MSTPITLSTPFIQSLLSQPEGSDPASYPIDHTRVKKVEDSIGSSKRVWRLTTHLFDRAQSRPTFVLGLGAELLGAEWFTRFRTRGIKGGSRAALRDIRLTVAGNYPGIGFAPGYRPSS